MRSAAALALFVALAACGGGGSSDPFVADLRMICSAADGHQDLPPEMRAVEAMHDVAGKIKTPEAARLLSSVIEAAPADRAALLAPALAKAKLSRCPTLLP